MTNIEALDILKRLQDPEPWEPQLNSAAYDALDMAIAALEKQEGKKPVSSKEQHYGRSERGLIELGWAKADETRNKEIVYMFSGFSNDILFVAYECARCLRDYGVTVSKAWDTMAQQSEALNRAYIQGRQYESNKWRERDERERQRGY